MNHDEFTSLPEGALYHLPRRGLFRGGAIRMGAAAGITLVAAGFPVHAAARARPDGGTA